MESECVRTDRFLKLLSAEICGLASYIWGNLDGLLRALIVFMVIDYVTGVIEAFHSKRLSSKVGFVGIARKGEMMLVVAVGHILDQAFGGGSFCRDAVVGFYIANEGLSIMENTTAIGVPWPPVLIEALQQIKNLKNRRENIKDEREQDLDSIDVRRNDGSGCSGTDGKPQSGE